MWVYQVLDILSTILEGFCLYVISRCLCKEPRFQSAMLKYIPPIAEIILTAILTWFTELGAIKMPIIFIFVIAILRICYKDTIYQSITVVEIWFVVIVFLSESIYFSIGYWLYENNQLVQIDGQTFLKWEILIIALVVRLLVFCAVYWMMRHFIYKVQLKDSIVLTIVFLIAFIISFLANFNVLNSARFVDLIIYISSGVLATIFMIVFMYAKNVMFLREQEQRNQLQIAQLQQQFAYYQDKQKEEERVRALYHDLKNHLLVLEQQPTTEAARRMAETLRGQIAAYEDYVHTGNEFLDIILKDKAAKAREKGIDFSAQVDLHGTDFLDPLDLSTLFGNALDNAIEASEKLPEGQRLITLQGKRIRDMLLVTVENRAQPEARPAQGTSKEDPFLHGFGIPNMRQAAERYGGQIRFQQSGETFRVKLLLPVP